MKTECKQEGPGSFNGATVLINPLQFSITDAWSRFRGKERPGFAAPEAAWTGSTLSVESGRRDAQALAVLLESRAGKFSSSAECQVLIRQITVLQGLSVSHAAAPHRP